MGRLASYRNGSAALGSVGGDRWMRDSLSRWVRQVRAAREPDTRSSIEVKAAARKLPRSVTETVSAFCKLGRAGR